ncbi:hypothetical protein GCM10009691_04080 [Brevibacterium picturae]|uniref:Uncharacterized protein n=2 Tax=Brevibacterium picturae TaxID=260553 RepID=A0ABN2B217_9MICO
MVMFFGLSGCVSRPDLSNRAEEIAEVIAGLPGVEEVDDYYQNGFTSGQSLTYKVKMVATATDAEIANVASTVDSEAGDQFDEYDRELTLNTPEILVVLRGELDIDELRQRLLNMQSLNTSLTSERLTWKENDGSDRENELEIEEASQNPFSVLSAVRDQFGSEQMRVNFGSAHMLSWDVTFPYSVQAQNRLASALRPLPQELSNITIRHDQVTEVDVRLDDPGNAVNRLMAITDRVSSGTSAPWMFRWSAGQPPAGQGNLATGGTVSVGACDYYEDGEREKDPAGHMTQDAIDVQNQLRSKYDTCG